MSDGRRTDDLVVFVGSLIDLLSSDKNNGHFIVDSCFPLVGSVVLDEERFHTCCFMIPADRSMSGKQNEQFVSNRESLRSAAGVATISQRGL